MPQGSQKLEQDKTRGDTLSVQFDLIRAALERGDANALSELLNPIHAADIADLVEQIDPKERKALLELAPTQFDGDVLSELDETLREDVIGGLEPKALARAVRDLESDDVVDLVEDLEEPQKEIILDALGDADRAVVEQSLAYPEETAGRLMQREIVTAPADWNVGQMIDFLRDRKDLPEQFYHVILVDQAYHPVSYITLGKILSSRRETKLRGLSEDKFHTLNVHQPVSDVAYAFNQYHLISAPVIDETNRLVGVVTIDDAMTALDEEADEDIKRLAGIGDESLLDTAFEIAYRRFPWLFVNLLTAILASIVIAQFEFALSKFVALAILMPIIASMGGNAGTQSLTVAVRALATRDLTAANAWRVLRREITAGLANGALFAVIIGVIGYFWFDSAMLGLIAGLSMIINLAIAALVGILVPLYLDHGKMDPALASGAFVTMVTDVVGFFVFLSLASVLMF